MHDAGPPELKSRLHTDEGVHTDHGSHTDHGIYTTDRPARCVPEVSALKTDNYCCSTAMWGRLRYCSQ